MIKKISLVVISAFYIGAGINHFWHPQGYYEIIPPYLPWHSFINIISGLAEISLGVLFIFSNTRKLAAYGTVVMLILFIPAHIYMIQKGGCMGSQMCIPLWVAWLRLFPLQFILIWWAWWHKK